jgi:prepilin-type N-terminal cleavage/methylation domain-containing protein
MTKNTGFTLIELMIAVAVIGILAVVAISLLPDIHCKNSSEPGSG